MKRFLLLTLFFQFHFCVNPELNNPCDPRSTAYRNSILTKILIADNTSFCGLRFSSGSSAQWTQEAYIKAPNGESSDWFGWNVAIDSSLIAISAKNEDSNQTTITNGETASSDNSLSGSGAVYIIRKGSSGWKHEAYIKPPNPDVNDGFGESISLSNDTLIVGVLGEDSNQTTITNGGTASIDNSSTNSGAVYVFRYSNSAWSQEAYIKATNVSGDDRFGQSVSISGDTIVVGAAFEDSNQTTITNGVAASLNNSAIQSGAVYVYKRLGNSWFQEAYIKASNSEDGDLFGSAVAIDQDTIVVGAPSEDSNTSVIINSGFGSNDNSLPQSGSAYVFRRNGSNWNEEAYLKAPNVDSGDEFGSTVAISNNRIVIGAVFEDASQNTITNGDNIQSDNSSNNSGAVYVFKREINGWISEAYLKASNSDSADRFGFSLSIYGDSIVVGAPYEDSSSSNSVSGGNFGSNNNANDSGASYVFRKDNQIWREEAYIKASNVGTNDYFGASVSIKGDYLVVGARFEDSNQTTITNGGTASNDNSAGNSGAAYVFVRK